jgi:hypothetical protein
MIPFSKSSSITSMDLTWWHIVVVSRARLRDIPSQQLPRRRRSVSDSTSFKFRISFITHQRQALGFHCEHRGSLGGGYSNVNYATITAVSNDDLGNQGGTECYYLAEITSSGTTRLISKSIIANTASIGGTTVAASGGVSSIDAPTIGLMT